MLRFSRAWWVMVAAFLGNEKPRSLGRIGVVGGGFRRLGRTLAAPRAIRAGAPIGIG